MSRLPNPGSDSGSWGDILNDFLVQSHNADGTLKSSAVSASGAATDSSVVHNTGAEIVAGTKTFSASPVVPAPTLGSHAANKTYVDATVAAGAPDATTSSKGIVQLAGDLGGTGTTAATPVIADNAITTSKINNGAVTSSKIADGTIVDADISGTAAIAKSKLAALNIADADVATGAAIAKSKLAALNISDADVSAISESKITNLTSDLAAKVPTSRTITAGTGLTGGGDLSADRTLAVAYGTGAGTAAQGNDSRIINSADKSSASTQAFTGSVSSPAIIATGLTGAVAASRYAGATASGAPASGTFAVGDFVIDQTGKIWICTVAGTPGTWTLASGPTLETTTAPPATNTSGSVLGVAATAARSDHTHQIGAHNSLHDPYYAPQIPALVYTIDPRLPASTGGSSGIGVLRGARVIVPRTGTLTDFAIFVTVQSGNIDVGILDTSATTRNRLWSTGSVACPAAGAWTTYNPNLSVTAGQQLDFVFVADNTTATLPRYVTGGNYAGLPTSFHPAAGGATPRLVWNGTGSSFPIPSTYAESNMTVSVNVPLIIARVS